MAKKATRKKATKKPAKQAEINIVAEYWEAKTRLEDLWQRAKEVQELSVELNTLKEISHLLDLYSKAKAAESGGDPSGDAAQQLDLIAQYVLPLKLIDDKYPLTEHVRVCAEMIRQHDLANV